MRVAPLGGVAIESGLDPAQTDGVGRVHRPALQRREAVAVAPHDVDVAGAVGDALLEDPRALVDQRIWTPPSRRRDEETEELAER